MVQDAACCEDLAAHQRPPHLATNWPISLPCRLRWSKDSGDLVAAAGDHQTTVSSDRSGRGRPPFKRPAVRYDDSEADRAFILGEPLWHASPKVSVTSIGRRLVCIMSPRRAGPSQGV